MKVKSASTSRVCAPWAKAVAGSGIDFDSALQVGWSSTWSASSTACSPVDLVNLPKSNVECSVWVVVHRIGVSPTFMWNNTFAACLIPIVFCTPCADILDTFSCSAWTTGAFSTRAVSTTCLAECYWEHDEHQNDKFHIF